MKLSIKQVLDIPGESENFSGKLNLSEVLRHGKKLFPNLLAVEGSVFNRAGVVTLRYQISSVFPFECDRCLKQTELTFSSEFEHTVVYSLEDEELEDVFLLAPDAVLAMETIAAADILLSLPQVLLCCEECRGLCSKCGINLNSSTCNCAKKEIDPRLLALQSLLDN